MVYPPFDVDVFTVCPSMFMRTVIDPYSLLF